MDSSFAFAAYDKDHNGGHDGEPSNGADYRSYDGATRRSFVASAAVTSVEVDLSAAGHGALAECIDDIQGAGKARLADRGAHTRGLWTGWLDRTIC